MASVFDVANYILINKGPMTSMKLQKLVYYCQAWALVWDEEPMFNETIEAWTNGPVAPALFDVHRGKYMVDEQDVRGNPHNIKPKHKETIDMVLEDYGDKSSQWLIELTHNEYPWKQARSSVQPGQRGNAEILPSTMADYYGSLVK